jgi:hypothetical protein
MRSFLLVFGLIMSRISFAQGTSSPPPVPEAKPVSPSTFVAQGEAVEVPEEGFVIVPPIGWEVTRNIPGTTFLFQGPKIQPKPGETTYQSNIRIMSLDPEPMDEASKEKYTKLILDNSSKLSGVTAYNLRSAEKVTLSSGLPGYLYYTEFTLNTTPMMQMHVLVSSAKNSYLMTYTDLASVFELENSPALTTAYTSMQSVKLASKPVDRFAQIYVAAGGVIAILLLSLIVHFVRGYRMKRLGDRIESEDAGENENEGSLREEDDEVSGFAEIGNASHRLLKEQEDEDMPETREVQRTVAREEQVHVPRPSAPVSPHSPKAAATPKPTPRPKVKSKDAVDSKAVPSAPKVPPPQIAKDGPLVERTSATQTNPIAQKQSLSVSNLSELKPRTVVPAKKSKPQKIQSPGKVKSPPMDADDDASDVARLSEILPNTGNTKKKGLFGWGKAKANANDKADHIGDEDSWDQQSKKSPRKSSDEEEQPLSEVVGWNLKGSDARGSGRDDEGDD